jgi:hypothetical protein
MTDTPIFPDVTNTPASSVNTAPAVIVDPIVGAIPYTVALVIDGVVQDTITCEVRLASILLSSPTIVELSSQPRQSLIGWTYDSVNNQILPPTVA